MVFHEITPEAIRRAVDNPREIDADLVDAQETRRILDRLYGYEVSPVLWKKVMPRLSAGRVQSVATRLVVERERARMRFRSAEYWDIEGLFALTEHGGRGRPVDVHRHAGRARRRPDRHRPRLRPGDRPHPQRRACTSTSRAPAAWSPACEDADFAVTRVEEKPYRRRPYPPFMTSTLQQEAGRKLRFSVERTMRTAQRLYENGYITYMRTDSTNLSETALTAARQQARELYGDEYVPPEPRRYVRKVKNAQEAHEAIRPAGDAFRTPGAVADELSADEFRLYELIWQRTLASQMADAVGTSVSVRLGRHQQHRRAGRVRGVAARPSRSPASSGRTWRASTTGDADRDDSERRLPRLRRDQPLDARELTPQGHTTTPPARYTEPSLVKAMEELGHRPPVDLRVDPADHPGPRVRLEEGQRARPVLDRVRGGQPAGAALHPAGRLRVHRLGRGGPRQHRRRRHAVGRLADAGSTSARRTARRAASPAPAG